MNLVKRSWCYVTRKKIKTMILFGILFCMSVTLISGTAIFRAVNQTAGELQDTLLAGFTMGNNMPYNMGTSRGAGNIPENYIEEIAGLEGINSYFKRMIAAADLKNAKTIEMDTPSSYDQSTEEHFKQTIDVTGVNRSDLDPKFYNGTLVLTQGRHLKDGDVKKVLVHERFAKENGLGIGDVLKLQANPYDSDNINKSTVETEAEIVGLFSGKNSMNVVTKQEMSENVVITDLDTVRTLYQYTKESSIFMDASFFVRNSGRLDDIMKEAMKLPINWNAYQISKLSQSMSGMMESVSMIRGMTAALMIGAVVVCIVVLVLVLMLWMGERKRETGILLSLGVSKKQIFAQYVLELILILFVSCILSMAAGKTAASRLGDRMTSQASANYAEQVNSQVNGMLGADLEIEGLIKTVTDLDVTVQTTDIFAVFAGGLFIVLISVSAASVPMFKVNPKELL